MFFIFDGAEISAQYVNLFKTAMRNCPELKIKRKKLVFQFIFKNLAVGGGCNVRSIVIVQWHYEK